MRFAILFSNTPHGKTSLGSVVKIKGSGYMKFTDPDLTDPCLNTKY